MSIYRYNPEIHHRKSIRLKGYNYAQEGLYFITLCIQDRENIFGTITDGVLTLNAIGTIALKEWLHTIEVRDNIKLHECIIMPNHIHGIIEIIKDKSNPGDNEGFKSPTQTIGAIVRGYKIATIKQIKEYIGKVEDSKGDISKGDTSNGDTSNGEFSKGDISKGELQFAPTNAPTNAPTVPTTPTILNIIKNLDYKIWQRNYYERIIKDERAYQNISNYIITNPEKWYDDKFYK